MNRSPAEVAQIVANAIARIDNTNTECKVLQKTSTAQALALNLNENLLSLHYDEELQIFHISNKKHHKYLN